MREIYVTGLVEAFSKGYDPRISEEDAALILESVENHKGDVTIMRGNYERRRQSLANNFWKRKRDYDKIIRQLEPLCQLEDDFSNANLLLEGEKITLSWLVQQFEAKRGAEHVVDRERPLFSLNPLHRDYLAELPRKTLKLLTMRDVCYRGSWDKVEKAHPSRSSEIAELRLYERIHGINLCTYFKEFLQRCHQQSDFSGQKAPAP